MKNDKHIRPIEQEDIFIVAEHLRNIDRIEMYLEDPHIIPLLAIKKSVEASIESYAGVTEKGTPVCLFGAGAVPVTDFDVTYTPVWFLATAALDQSPEYRMKFMRSSRQWIEHFYKTYGPIGNSIWIKNKESRKWLSWCGFEILGSHYLSSGNWFMTMAKL